MNNVYTLPDIPVPAITISVAATVVMVVLVLVLVPLAYLWKKNKICRKKTKQQYEKVYMYIT